MGLFADFSVDQNIEVLIMRLLKVKTIAFANGRQGNKRRMLPADEMDMIAVTDKIQKGYRKVLKDAKKDIAHK